MNWLRRSPFNRLEALLEAQHKALISGDISRLSKMDAELQAALVELARFKTDPEKLSQIKRSAARNASLIEAARIGLARAKDMLGASGASGLGTYDNRGVVHQLRTPNGKTSLRR